MQIITTHVNTDFDALASLVAAKKLYPQAKAVLTTRQNQRVKDFLSIYRDAFDLTLDRTIDWEKVTDIILVDVAALQRVSPLAKKINLNNLKVTIYDHHPPKPTDLSKDAGEIEAVGATITLLVEKIQRRQIDLTPLEATLFGLGVYTDTGFFTYKHTTARDLKVASYLLEKGMNLNIVRRFTEQSLIPEQQQLLDELFHQATLFEINGLDIVLSQTVLDDYVGGLALVTEKMLQINGAAAVINVVEMNGRIYIVGRASSPRVSLLPILKKWGGGGHRQAGSALVRDKSVQEIYEAIRANLELILLPAIRAKDIMSYPVKTITSDTRIERAGHLMYRYGHSGYPVVDDGHLVGLITRRDLDKAIHHGLGHAPVKAYMSTNLITIEPTDTLEEIQQAVIEHNVGRLPVLSDGKLVGILTRTNIIEAIHSEGADPSMDDHNVSLIEENIQEKMADQLPRDIYQLLIGIGEIADQTSMNAYLVGGIVRDIFLERPNDDIDIVVEGNGIYFAEQLQRKHGGEIIAHADFGTSTWQHPSGQSIDIASSRLEYYDQPASLPDVELSTLNEDLYRRDFTINAMAICLNSEQFGRVVDPFSGQKDLLKKEVKILHNLSFVEDPTRIFRAVRFETRFDFKMDEQTKKLAIQSIDKIKNLSKNRILNEMERLFAEIEPAQVIRRLFTVNFWQQFNISKSVQDTCEQHVGRLKKYLQNSSQNESVFKVSETFHYFLVPFYYGNQLSTAYTFALKRPERKLIKEIKHIVEASIIEYRALGDIHRQLKNVRDETILFVAAGEAYDEKLLLDYLSKRRKMPAYLSGEDLLETGLKQGPIYANLLFQLEIEILNGQIQSREGALRWLKEKTSEY